MKFVLFVEGHTEKLAVPSFLKRWLDKKLKQPVGIKIVRFEGWGHYEHEIASKTARRDAAFGERGRNVAGVGETRDFDRSVA